MKKNDGVLQNSKFCALFRRDD